MESILQYTLDCFYEFTSNYKRDINKNTTIEKLNVQTINSLLREDDYLDISIVNNIKTMRYGERRLVKMFLNDGIIIDLTWEFWDHKINEPKLLNYLFEYTCFIIYYLNKILPVNRSLVIYLYNYDGKKKIPLESSILKGINVNSGVTYYSQSMSTVMVYRKEEMIKVLTHELIHALGIDDKNVPPYKISKFNEKFCVDRDININETFTDALACLINITMYSILEDSKDLKRLKSRFKIHFKNEISFIKAQSYKVLLLNKYRLLPEDIKCTIKNDEKTNGIAYYVLKAVVFEKFINYILKYNYVLKDADDFIKFIDIGVNNVNCGTFGKNDYFKLSDKRTLRMSSIDILELINLNKTI